MSGAKSRMLIVSKPIFFARNRGFPARVAGLGGMFGLTFAGSIGNGNSSGAGTGVATGANADGGTGRGWYGW